MGLKEHHNKTTRQWSWKPRNANGCFPHPYTVDLVRLQGRITDSGNIIVNRPVPFSLVKEVWFCIPKDNDRRGFDHIEQIMDEDLEDEMALEYPASPILRE